MRSRRLLATLLSVVLLSAAVQADSASAATAPQLSVAVGDRLGLYPSVLVAGKVVTLTASVYAFYGGRGCDASDFAAGAPATATITVPPAVDLLGAAPTQTVPVPVLAEEQFSGEAPEVINIHWSVHIPRPLAYHGQLKVTIPSRSGKACNGQSPFTIAAVAEGPRFRVLEGYADRGAAVVVVSASLPSRGLTSSAIDAALPDALEELQDPLGEEFGHNEADLLSVQWRGHALSAFGGGSSDASRHSCLDFGRRTKLHQGALLHYKLHFDWNAGKGFAARHQSGTIRLRNRPRTHAGKVCAQDHPVEGYENIGH